jgi:hypothetical protein
VLSIAPEIESVVASGRGDLSNSKPPDCRIWFAMYPAPTVTRASAAQRIRRMNPPRP